MKKKQIIALTLFAMKFTIVQSSLAVLFACVVSAKDINAQVLLNKSITINVEKTDLKKVITLIQQQTGVKFIYSSKVLQTDRKITCAFKKITLANFIQEVLKPLNINYKIVDEKLLLYSIEDNSEKQILYSKPVIDDVIVKGVVKSSKGELLEGVTVKMENTGATVSTDKSGYYEFKKVAPGQYKITFSYVGFLAQTTSVVVAEGATLDIAMVEDVLKLQEIVVTGGNPKKKIETSVAITTVSNKDIQVRAPLSNADMLKAIPGLTVESTGGEGPGNVFVRGFPQQGGYIFIGIMEDGLPVLPTGFNSIPSADQYYKTDLTIKGMEAVRGGNASIIMPNTPGAVVNNISYTGAEKTYGQVKLTSGLSQDLYRLDANVGGKVSSHIKYNIGGFYRTDKGAISPGYTVNQGGQLKGNMTFDFKNKKGFIRVYGKYLNDKVQWMLPSYYPYNGTGKPADFGTFDMSEHSLAPSDTKFDYTDPSGRANKFDFSDGIHTRLGYGGLQFNYITSNGWQINNNFRYQDTKTNITAALPGTGTLAYETNKSYSYLGGSPAQFGANDRYVSLTAYGYFNKDKQIVNFLDFKKKVSNHNITLGTSIFKYEVNDLRYQFRVFEQLKDKPKRLLIGTTTGNGVTPLQLLTRIGNTTMTSAYASDEITLNPKWRLDVGARIDNFNITGKVPVYLNGSSGSMVINSYTPFKNTKAFWGVSAGLNYKINEAVAMFARLTKAYNAPSINDFTVIGFNPATIKDRPVYLSELGVKYARNRLSFFASASYSSIKNVTLSITAPSQTLGNVTLPAFGSTRTVSAEVEAYYKLSRGLSLRLTTTVQDAKYTDYKVTVNSPSAPADLQGKTFDFTGNSTERVPKINSELSATYDYKKFNVYVAANYIGSRFTSPSESYKLPSYTTLKGGAGYNFTKKIAVRGWVDNLLNTKALTEGDVRGDQFRNFATVAPGTLMPGRPLLPRTFWASISYTF